jgi:ribosomal protein S12 methylthiotransferase accessory factor
MESVPNRPDSRFLEIESSIFRPVRTTVFSPQAFFDEFTTLSRFKSPLSAFEKIQLWLAKRFSSLPLFTGVQFISPYPSPSHWQILLNYLHREGILESPEFNFRPRANNLPQSYSITLSPLYDMEKTSGRDVRDQAMGYGGAFTIESAYGKAIGETIERCLLTLYKDQDLFYGTYSAFRRQGRNPLNIGHLNSFLPWQKERNQKPNVTHESVVSWVSGTELLSEKKVLLPAQCVFWNYRFRPEETVLLNPTTNGGAGHFTFEEAVLAGLYEGVERDAFFLYWLNTISPPIIDIDTFPSGSVAHEIRARCERYGLQVYFLDTTSDIPVPSCVCALVDPREPNLRVTIGGGSGFDIEKNVSSSFLEALSVSNYALSLEQLDLPIDYEPFSGNPPIGKKERISFWKGRQALDRFSFFISGEKIRAHESSFYKNARKFNSAKEEYVYMLNVLREKGEGYELYCYTATHPVLKRIGYIVVKVIVPKLFPLYLREHMATLESERLRQAASRFGTDRARLNPLPHPYP